MEQEKAMVNKQMKVKFLHLKSAILLDMGSTLKATFISLKLFIYIITIRNPSIITTNDGTKRVTLEATVKGLVHSWYDPTK